MVKPQTLLFYVTVVAFASIVHRAITLRRFHKFEKRKEVVGVIREELKTSSQVQCSQRYDDSEHVYLVKILNRDDVLVAIRLKV